MVSRKERKKQLKKNHSKEDINLILKNECPDKKSPSQRKLERIANSITPLILKEDKRGKYLHYCTYPIHPGILGETYMKKEGCLEKECKHYKKLYVK